jgi:hypothetical protein
MLNMTCDFCVKMSVVRTDNDIIDVNNLDERSVRKLAKGRIFLTFEEPRHFILIESEVLDYLLQLKGVIDQFDSGNYRTFTVSPDYYSNHLEFTYIVEDRQIEIYEANGGDFRFAVSYGEFRKSYLDFFHTAIYEFLTLYPALSNSNFFRNILDCICCDS